MLSKLTGASTAGWNGLPVRYLDGPSWSRSRRSIRRSSHCRPRDVVSLVQVLGTRNRVSRAVEAGSEEDARPFKSCNKSGHHLNHGAGASRFEAMRRPFFSGSGKDGPTGRIVAEPAGKPSRCEEAHEF